MNDHQPPQDIGAERDLLGGLILAPKAIPYVIDKLTADDFYQPKHGAIFDAIVAVHDAGNRPDVVTIIEYLRAGKNLDRCGGGNYVYELYQGAVTAANIDYYVEIITAAAAQRRAIETAVRIHDFLQRDVLAEDVPDLLEQARGMLDEVTAKYRGRRDDEGEWIGDLAAATLARYAEPQPPAVATGFPDLDDLLDGGLRPGTFTVIGARPSVGKSILGEQIALQVVQNEDRGVLFASLEMSRAEVMDRAFAQLGGIELSHLTRHELTDYDWRKVREWTERLKQVPLRVEDTPHLSMSKLRGLARDLTRHPAGCGLVVADYLQLMTSGKRAESRQLEVSEFSRQLKLLAKELHCPVIALAQLNRAVEGRSTPRPVLSDLRESGSIEQDADNVWFLWDDPELQGERQLTVAKTRQGRTGEVRLQWSPHYARANSLRAV
ncbi:replicative DNA helicase [Amycolatopsis sp. NPDC004368]